MKNSNLKIALATILIGGSSFLAVAQDSNTDQPTDKSNHKKEWHHKKGRHHGERPDFLGEKLTDQQKEKIKSLRLDLAKKTMPLKNELNEKRAELRTLTTVESPNMKKVNLLIEDMGKIEVELKKARVANRMEIRNQLTEEQRIMFDSRGGHGRGHHMNKARHNRR